MAHATLIWENLTEADKHFRMGNYAQAIESANAQLLIEPTNSWAYVIRGDSQLRLRRFDSAIIDYTQAITHNKSNSLAYAGRGLALLRKGNFESASHDHEHEAIFGVNFAWLAQERGIACASIGQYQRSLKELKFSIERRADKYMPFFAIGCVYLALKEFEKALDSFSRALRLAPTKGNIRVFRALAMAGRRDFAQALSECYRAIETDRSTTNYAILGVILRESGASAGMLTEIQRKMLQPHESDEINFDISWFIRPEDIGL